MSTNDSSPAPEPGEGGRQSSEGGRQPTEAEMMAAYEEQMKNVRVEEVVVQSLASLIELGGRRAGLVPGAQDEADPAQLQVAIEAIMALQPVVAPLLGPNAGQVDQALSQLQLAFAQQTGSEAGESTTPPGPGGPAAAGRNPSAPGGTGPDDRPGGGRLWVPGQ